MEMIPDLTHYAAGLGSATFPLRVRTDENSNSSDDDGLSVIFMVATLENIIVDIVLTGQGFRVLQTAAAAAVEDSAAQTLPERQQEARSGKLYETIEALLMALSPGFEQFFGDELSRKLGAISGDRFYREECYIGSDDDRDEDNHGMDK
ncbi:hypothetical protein BGZ75_008588 [Mortierella antarctica]|nr:hypothetical protein BGZ75_008588 [Mortierella antarctica]